MGGINFIWSCFMTVFKMPRGRDEHQGITTCYSDQSHQTSLTLCALWSSTYRRGNVICSAIHALQVILMMVSWQGLQCIFLNRRRKLVHHSGKETISNSFHFGWKNHRLSVWPDFRNRQYESGNCGATTQYSALTLGKHFLWGLQNFEIWTQPPLIAQKLRV